MWWHRKSIRRIKMTEWISYLDDIAPDNGQIVLVYNCKRGCRRAKYSCGVEDYGSYDIEYDVFLGQDSCGEYTVIMDDVVFWMPLPEPPDVVDETFGKYKGTAIEKFKENE
jgi:hypothetical protein